LARWSPDLAAGLVQAHHSKLQEVVRIFSDRARSHDLELTSEESEELARTVDDRAQALLGIGARLPESKQTKESDSTIKNTRIE
jgi:hypothetical protein